MIPLRRNIELKVRCANLEKARDAIRNIGAVFERIVSQVDTYFYVANGRLKLREIDAVAAELIWYDRPDAAEFRDSRYIVVPISDPVSLKAALTAANGTRGEVRKTRELWMYHQVRIHLDTVAGLGDFIEFEAVCSEADSDAVARGWLNELYDVIGIEPEDIHTSSYSDLMG